MSGAGGTRDKFQCQHPETERSKIVRIQWSIVLFVGKIIVDSFNEKDTFTNSLNRRKNMQITSRRKSGQRKYGIKIFSYREPTAFRPASTEFWRRWNPWELATVRRWRSRLIEGCQWVTLQSPEPHFSTLAAFLWARMQHEMKTLCLSHYLMCYIN